MNCWTVLDLPDDADERSIRRRYAQLLKIHRPDEDPVAFQRLREAYERALQLARWRAEQAQEESEQAQPDTFAAAGASSDAAMALSQAAGLPAALHLQQSRQRIEPDPAQFPAPEEQEPEPAWPLETAARSQENTGGTLSPAAGEVHPQEVPVAVSEVQEQAWFADSAAPALEAALTAAEAIARRDLFESALLRECLSERADAPALIRWALQRLHWFELGQRSELPLPAMNALAARLAGEAIDELAADLHAGRERMFIECLRMLLATGWLQGFDRRAQFQQALAQLLLETPGWSDALFGAVCDICGWSEGNFADPWQWQALVRRAEEVAFDRRLRGLLEGSRALDAEQKAAWLLLKPMPAAERARFKRGLGEEDWAAYGLLCDKLRYRYPALWNAWGCGEPEEPADIAPSRDGWRYSSVALFLLLLVGFLIEGAGRGAFAVSLAEVIPLTIVAALGTAFLCWVMRGWSWLSDVLLRVDVTLSRWLLLDTWVDGRRGLLLIRHLLPCAALAWMVAGASDLSREKTAALWLLIFLGSGFYSLLAVRGYSLVEIGLVLLVQGLRGTVGKVLLVLTVVAALATLAVVQADRPPVGMVPESTSEVACDEACERWVEANQALFEQERAKRASDEGAR